MSAARRLRAVLALCMRGLVLSAVILCASGGRAQQPPDPELRIRLQNLSPLPRTTWVPVVVPGETGFQSFVSRSGQKWIAVKGERVGNGSVYRIAVPLQGSGKIDGVLSGGLRPPPFVFHPWVTDNVAALIPRIFVIDGASVAVSQLTELTLVSNSPAHQRYHLRGFLAGGFILEMWIECLSGDPVINYWGALIWSDRNDARVAKRVDAIHIESGEFIALDFARRNGFRLPLWRRNQWRITLPGPMDFVDGSGIPFRGRILAMPEVGPIDPIDLNFANLLAGLYGPVHGVATQGWVGRWLGNQNIPRLAPDAQIPDSIQPDISAGHIYDDRRLGIAKMPGQTGDQEDFGATKGSAAITFADAGYIPLAAHSIEQDFFRGFLHYEHGRMLDLSLHPRWVTWSGSTHWNHNVSPDRLGKDDDLGGSPSTGWIGYDDQHRSQNNLAALFQLTGDPLARLLIEHAINTDRAMVPDRIGAPRAVGRLLLCWANFAALGSKTAKVLMADKISAITAHWPGKEAQGTVKILGWGLDPRLNVTDANGADLPAWSAWEHGLAAVGLYAAYKQGVGTKELVLDVCRTVVKHAIFWEDDEWVWVNNIHYPLEDSRLGLPLPEGQYRRGSTFINEASRFGGVSTWAFPAFLIFAELADAGDPDLPRCRLIMGSITHGAEAEFIRMAEWWAAVRRVAQ